MSNTNTKKKKIFICMTGAMEPGGVERSLIGLLDAFDYEKYEVDLFLYAHHGDLINLINPKVNLLPEVRELAYLRESMSEKIKHGALYAAWRRVVTGITKEENDFSWAKIVKKCVRNFPVEYDLAMSFFLPFDLIRDKVNAKCKIGWIHTDYTQHKAASVEYLQKSYVGINYIIAVSEDVRKSFVSLVPQFSDRILVIENILPRELIIQQSLETDVSSEMPESGCMNLLSIGRYSYAKNFDNIPDICRRLIDSGYNIKWYIIGYGTDEELISRKIDECGMESHVFLLGKKDNPYPYIRCCDIYIQPSRYEGKCVAVREAQMLGKPVVITKYPTSSSQLDDGVDGIIVPLDNEGCARGIAYMIDSKDLRNDLINNCKVRDYSNSNEINKLYRLIP